MWNALNRIGKASCITSTVRLAKCGERNFAWAKPTPAMSSRTVRPPICVRGSRIAFSSDRTLLRNTFSTAHLYGSQFSGIEIRKRIIHWMVFGIGWGTSLTNTDNVNNGAVGITVGQRLLHLHFQNVVHIRWRRHTKQIRWISFHSKIFANLKEKDRGSIQAPNLNQINSELAAAHHSKRFVHVEFFRAQKSQEKRIIAPGAWNIRIGHNQFFQFSEFCISRFHCLAKFLPSLLLPFDSYANKNEKKKKNIFQILSDAGNKSNTINFT